MRSLLLLIALLAAAPLPSAFAQSAPEEPAAAATPAADSADSADSAATPAAAGAHLEDARALYQAGHWDDAAAAFERAFELAPARSELRVAAALEGGSLLWEQGRYARARQKVSLALNLARELELTAPIGQLLLTLGHIESATGNVQGAEDTLNICVQLTGEHDDAVYRALCRMNRRVVRTLLGKDPGSQSDLRADITTLQNTDSLLAIGTALTRTADLYQDNGDLAQARQLLDEARRHIEASESVPARARHHLRLAQLLKAGGDFQEASALLDKALPLFESMNNRPMIVHALGLKADIALDLNHPEQALPLYRRALAVADATDNPLLEGRVHLALCELITTGSLQHCERAISTFTAGHLATYRVRAHASLARALQLSNRLEGARTNYRQAIELTEALPRGRELYASSLANQYANLCQVNTRLNATGALSSCLEARTRLQALPADEDDHQRPLILASVIHSAGMAALQENNAERALDLLATAAELAMALPAPHLNIASDAYLRLGATLAALPDRGDEARDALEKGLRVLATAEEPRSTDYRRSEIALLMQLAQLQLKLKESYGTLATLDRLNPLATELRDYTTLAHSFNLRASAHLLLNEQDAAYRALSTAQIHASRSGDHELMQLIYDNVKRFER
ncbi:hypothetical protein DL240_18650 [Lujinxingia litoralis]|uniref:MalT-like TPR region domain-containing protein n=1 Tax=Lujinxingia litoralis TaxID=2211119 RepID=A0A328C531_9DELT|nr:tetratricopeptide repeat protein [Lujinxingia litoralis]RAL20130.1 hypothetical protein DL240_18650 [Lujinxingia litoralis]